MYGIGRNFKQGTDFEVPDLEVSNTHNWGRIYMSKHRLHQEETWNDGGQGCVNIGNERDLTQFKQGTDFGIPELEVFWWHQGETGNDESQDGVDIGDERDLTQF